MTDGPILSGNDSKAQDAEMARLRRTIEAQAAALSNLALTAQLLAEQIEELRGQHRTIPGSTNPTTLPPA